MSGPLTRRRFLGVAGGALAGAGLAACGGSSSGDSASNGGGAGGAARATTRTVSTATGPVRVPVRPRRIACLDPGFSWETLVEVGITPVGLPLVVDSIVSPANLAAIKGVPTLLDAGGDPNLEKVAKADPDLILTLATPQLAQVRKDLSSIAPVAAYSFDFPSDWPALDHSYANAANRADRLTAVTDRYRRGVASLRGRFGHLIARQRWALVTQTGSQAFAWGVRSSAGPVLADAGATFSRGAPGRRTPFQPLSLEKLDVLDDATVLMYGADRAGRPYGATASLLAQPIFKRLPAARQGRVFALPSWFAYCYGDALAQLDGLARICRSLQTA